MRDFKAYLFTALALLAMIMVASCDKDDDILYPCNECITFEKYYPQGEGTDPEYEINYPEDCEKLGLIEETYDDGGYRTRLTTCLKNFEPQEL